MAPVFSLPQVTQAKNQGPTVDMSFSPTPTINLSQSPPLCPSDITYTALFQVLVSDFHPKAVTRETFLKGQWDQVPLALLDLAYDAHARFLLRALY